MLTAFVIFAGGGDRLSLPFGKTTRTPRVRGSSMQKPAAQVCGRVSSETIDYDENTPRDRTSPVLSNLVLHKAAW
jgi:hypothetical protein